MTADRVAESRPSDRGVLENNYRRQARAFNGAIDVVDEALKKTGSVNGQGVLVRIKEKLFLEVGFWAKN